MNKFFFIFLNFNEIFIEENEVSLLFCMSKCRCWFLRVVFLGFISDIKDGEGGREVGIFLG